MKFVINPGHGGSDPGACGNGIREKDLNLAVALAMVPLLTDRGIDVLLTRTGDITRSLQQRSDYIVKARPDAALDLHHNAAGDSRARGIESFRSLFNTSSKTLAEKIHPQLIAALDMPNRGIKTKLYPGRKDWDYYHMIREPHRQAGIPVALTESGFVSSPADAAIMKRADFTAKQAEALARGICAYLGVAWDKAGAPAASSPTTSNGALYRVQIGAYAVKANADAALKRVQAAGFKDAFITTTGESAADAPAPAPKPAPAPAPAPKPAPAPTIKVGSKVKVGQGARDYSGGKLASFVYARTYDVIQIAGDRVVIGEGKAVTAAVRLKDLTLV